MRKTGFEYDDRKEEEEESVYVYKIQVLGRVVLFRTFDMFGLNKLIVQCGFFRSSYSLLFVHFFLLFVDA